jgi:hypothetical protein
MKAFLGVVMKNVILLLALVASSASESAPVSAVLDDCFCDGDVSDWSNVGPLTHVELFVRGEWLAAAEPHNEAVRYNDSVTGVGADFRADGLGGSASIFVGYTSPNDALMLTLSDTNGNSLYDYLSIRDGTYSAEGFGRGRPFENNVFNLAFEIERSYVDLKLLPGGYVSAFVEATGETFGGELAFDYTGSGYGFSLNSGALNNFYIATVVPIPAAAWLFGSALLGLGWVRRTH